MRLQTDLADRVAATLSAAALVHVFNATLTWLQAFRWTATGTAPCGTLVSYVQDSEHISHAYKSPEFACAAFGNGPIMIGVHERSAWPIHLLDRSCISEAQARSRVILLTGASPKMSIHFLDGTLPSEATIAAPARSKRVRAGAGGTANMDTNQL